MSVVATTGVGMLARLIGRLGSGEVMTAAGFAADEGFARSTAFDVVRRMEDAGLLRRDLTGTLMAGPCLVKLALSPYGLASLHGPAEALLTQLRDETHGTARLIAPDGTALLTLAGYRGDRDGPVLEAAVAERARVELRLRPNTTRSEREHAQLRLARTAISLAHYLAHGDADG